MTDSQAKVIALAQANKMLAADDFDLFEVNFQFYRIDTDPQASPQREHKIMWQEDGLWYHTDETWSNRYGPFHTEDTCMAALSMYTSLLYTRSAIQ